LSYGDIKRCGVKREIFYPLPSEGGSASGGNYGSKIFTKHNTRNTTATETSEWA